MARIPDGKKAVEQMLAQASGRREAFRVGDRPVAAEEIVERLAGMLTDDRRARIEAILAERTYSVVSVVEGLVNSGNIAAVMRTAEGLGYQRMDIVAGSAPYKHSERTTQGADKWLDVHTWESPAACCAALKESGYRVVATHLDETAVPIGEFDFTVPTALVFGNELNGVSEEMLAGCDARCVIPIGGFVQSFNISVAAAVSLYHVREDRIRRRGSHGDLSEADRSRLRADFYIRALKNAQSILDLSSPRDDSPG